MILLIDKEGETGYNGIDDYEHVEGLGDQIPVTDWGAILIIRMVHITTIQHGKMAKVELDFHISSIVTGE